MQYEMDRVESQIDHTVNKIDAIDRVESQIDHTVNKIDAIVNGICAVEKYIL